MCIIRFKLKPALLSILLGISTAIYDNKGFSRVQPKGEISESNRVSQKMPVCSMMNGFAGQGGSNESGEESATP